MINGFVINNSGRSKHIFKKTVYPGQSVPLSYVYEVLSKKMEDDNVSFVDWLKSILPPGWDIDIEETFELPVDVSSVKVEDVITVEDNSPSLEFAPVKIIDKLTAKDIYSLRMKDNPKRVIKQITSVSKLRRALTSCINDPRKSMLATIIRHRIRELQG